MSLTHSVMVSDQVGSEVSRVRAMGGLSAFMYFLTVSLGIRNSPGDPTNGQTFALRPLHRLPSGRLQRRGLPVRGCCTPRAALPGYCPVFKHIHSCSGVGSACPYRAAVESVRQRYLTVLSLATLRCT